MKKLIAALLALVMVFSLAACGDKPDDTNTPDDPDISATPTDTQDQEQSTEKEENNTPVSGPLTVDDLRNHPETPASQFVYSESMENDGIQIDMYIGTDDIVVVPAEIDGRPVVDIAVVCFGNESIVKGIVIPESIKYIHEVFINNANLELVIAEGMETVGYGLFTNCANLREVVLGDNVVAIEESAFGNCPSLEKVNIPATLTEMTNAEIISSFYSTPKLTIYCEAGSYIEQVAIEHQIPYVNE